MTMPVLAALVRYPVKSLAGADTARAAVEPWGLSGDRRWMVTGPDGTLLTQREHPRLALAAAEPLPGGGLRLSGPGMPPLTVEVPDPATGTVVARMWRTKVEVVEAAPGAHTWLTAYLGTGARLVHLDAPGHRRPVDPEYSRPGETVNLADEFPLLLTTASSLEALNLLIAQGDHPDEGPLPMNRFRPNAVVEGTPPWAEDGWRRVRIGEVSFRVVKPCARCVVTTTDQTTGERGKEPLRTLARHRRFGDALVFGQKLIPEHTGVLRTGDPFEVLG
ncbi:MOSC N-terminal beta barrel domain-containing protein [Streptomyces sp. TRM 70361]|uniref:MOSC domain-containing protein n=1 Tax=Streptomyces sp. TRM 70361 TaxID=3116553 RepID=UPI002E7C1BF5|nr:MOSC N-terminal beta barrel domain-containing protein [Streptomyces sp. TRM 70361]MEE1940783.1 MOSC N-terminal beta barrel domain-containing protein [Streptomyces sp. TRM 70361]